MNYFCVSCKGKIKKRVTYLYEPEQKGYLCPKCWDIKHDTKPTKVE